jgi:hypothetical protein
MATPSRLVCSCEPGVMLTRGALLGATPGGCSGGQS